MRIYIETEAMPAEAIGRLLIALAADYRRCSRRSRLVLLKVESGTAAIAIAATAPRAARAGARSSDLCNFAKNIFEIVVRAQRGETARFGEGKQPPLKAARAILEAAIASKSPVRLEYMSPEGEVLKLEMDPARTTTAMATLKEAAAAKSAKPRATAKQAAKASGPPGELAGILELFDTRRKQAPPPPAIPDHDKAMAAAIVEALEATGKGEAAEVIAQKLEANRLDDLARMVRDGGDKVATLLTLEEAFARRKH